MEFLVGFVGLYYRKWAFKHPSVFLVESSYINPEDSCRPLRDFLNKISKLSHLNVLGLAHFMMYH